MQFLYHLVQKNLDPIYYYYVLFRVQFWKQICIFLYGLNFKILTTHLEVNLGSIKPSVQLDQQTQVNFGVQTSVLVYI